MKMGLTMSTVFGSDLVLGLITWALSFFGIPWICASCYLSKKIYIQYNVEPPLAIRLLVVIILILIYFVFFGQLVRPQVPIQDQKVLSDGMMAMKIGGISGVLSYIFGCTYSLHLKRRKKGTQKPRGKL